MTDTSGASPAPPELRPELRPALAQWCEAWKSCLQNVISQVSGNVATTFEISSQPLAALESDVWYTFVAGGSVLGEMTLRLPAGSGTRLARKFLGETEPAAGSSDEAITSESKEALEELLRQIAGLPATAVGAATGGEVQLQLCASGAPSWSSDAVVCLQTRDEAGSLIAIELRISPALATALAPKVQNAPTPAQTAPNPATAPAPELPPNSSYRRLLDVGLDVRLRFGTRRMLLRDVLALCAGVVVELDNTMHSPVDLLLDGRLIAQGEVVVVDGKYGLRVTQVVDSRPDAGSAT